jgi:hypothetical protein
MLSLRKLIVAASLAVAAATFAAAPSYAGICDQQGRKVQIKGVWHKVVRHTSGRLVNCGPAW